MKIVFSVPITSYISHMPPIIQDLGLGYLATAVRKEGHDALIRDWNMSRSSLDYQDYLRRERPDVIGLKVFTKDVGAAAKTIEAIRATGFATKIVVGGPHPSVTKPEELFDDLMSIDFAFRGEGEAGLPLLLRYLSMPDADPGRPLLRDIPGLVWRENGVVKSNPAAFTDVRQCGLPAWDLFDPATYPVLHDLASPAPGNSAPFITSRGCPGNCSFCSVNLISGSTIRRRPLQDIMDELSVLYHEYEVRTLMILDNGFLVDEEFVRQLCAALIAKGLKFTWDCVMIDTGTVLNAKTAGLMKEAGCKIVNLGVESGSPNMRRAIGKKSSLSQIGETVSVLRKNDIFVFGFFMMGFPSETKQDMIDTIRCARALDFKRVSFDLCYPIPGTRVYRHLVNTYKVDRIDWSTFDIHSSSYPLSAMDSTELSRLCKRANLEFMLRKDPLFYARRAAGLLSRVVSVMTKSDKQLGRRTP